MKKYIEYKKKYIIKKKILKGGSSSYTDIFMINSDILIINSIDDFYEILKKLISDNLDIPFQIYDYFFANKDEIKIKMFQFENEFNILLGDDIETFTYECAKNGYLNCLSLLKVAHI